MSKRYLIVEGYYDYFFYTALLKWHSIKGIEVKRPTDFGGSYNGKGNALILLKDLVPQLYDGTATKIGIIVDADFTDISRQGFHNTINQIHQKIAEYGYEPHTQPCNYNQGIMFRSSKGLPDIAAWIMPDNSSDGYLESLLLQVIDFKSVSCLEEAKAICNSLRCARYPAHQLDKAILAIFLAMQENPGRNVVHLIEKAYIDCQEPKLRKFINFIAAFY